MRRPPIRLLLPLLVLVGCAAPGASASRSPTPLATGTQPASAPPSVQPSPGGISNPGATWDSTSGLALVFGGDTRAGPGNELWGWDGSAWRLLDDGTGTAPSPRDDAQLIADPERGVVVLVGGRTDRGSQRTVHNDTWEWDGSTWSERMTDGAAGAPPARLHPVAGWDPARKRVLYAGGVFETEVNATDTWSWDGTSWTQLASEFPDAHDVPCRLALDAATGRLTVLAIDLDLQASPGLYVTRLWTWDGTRWASDAADGPPISPVQPIATTADGLLLADGGGLQGRFFTWTWDGSAWTQRPGEQPSARNGQVVVYDEARDRDVLVGGWLGNDLRTDVWEWDGATWTEVTPGR